jgi:D-sedoheptulose 7-phosphate isomerase
MGVYSEHEQVVLVPARGSTTSIDYHGAILNALTSRRTMLNAALAHLTSWTLPLTEVAVQLVETLRTGHKVLVAGNGGSAAEAQHFAAELVGRFKRERMPYAVLSLNTDTSILTAVANDYGYQDVFARQVNAFGQPDDMLMAFSTSGESENLLRAAVAGRERMMTVVAITGRRPSRLERLADVTVRVPVSDTDLAQELHMMVTHILCDIVESELAADAEGGSR